MNKHLFGCIFLIICMFFSCKPKEQHNFAEVARIVTEAEIIVNNYDSAVAVALTQKKINTVNILSQGAIDSTNLKLNELKNIKISPKNEVLRLSSINYIVSLKKLITAENQYALITDTTSITTAKLMDANVSKEINEIEQMRYKYRLVYKNSLK